ncbi:hypothetical protein AVEN_213209-1 [Araneus ventricosus]|uniref:DDE-1 domain-containing protein n=1 Tax=Araneus ventricosus TaxID=182803 RepID=A0A4Y2EP64_ARAVE|nr:hypothetical protein AVEN_6771-1 [Araneus ventricosus]GBM30226.1 hypothetical protein AVEN_60301-1 [Araneus ventricosus]GBM30297.1 hypothetical protein AVEN_189485-1 [Araneus ventricosus]GBM30312.1 hypothetical protein AVEN_213209-1 [Araneus ventricosus]
MQRFLYYNTTRSHLCLDLTTEIAPHLVDHLIMAWEEGMNGCINGKNYTVDSRLTGIGLSGLRIIRDDPPPQKTGSADCGRWNVREDRILLKPSYCIGLVETTLNPARLQLDCSENVDEKAVEQWINEDSTLECYEVSSDDDIVSRVTCGSEETKNFEECPESDEENLVTHQKISHGDALVHTEALLNYLEQEDESTPAEKMILRYLRSIIRRRVNEKQKQTSVISFFKKQ